MTTVGIMFDLNAAPLVSVDEINAFIGGEFGGNQNACEELSLIHI